MFVKDASAAVGQIRIAADDELLVVVMEHEEPSDAGAVPRAGLKGMSAFVPHFAAFFQQSSQAVRDAYRGLAEQSRARQKEARDREIERLRSAIAKHHADKEAKDASRPPFRSSATMFSQGTLESIQNMFESRDDSWSRK